MIQNHNERLQITVTKELAAKIKAASRRRWNLWTALAKRAKTVQ